MSREMTSIPGVGRRIAGYLGELGYTTVEALRGADPQAMYDRLSLLHGMTYDRCLLYVFRLAVYYAETDNPEPEKLKWWNWKG